MKEVTRRRLVSGLSLGLFAAAVTLPTVLFFDTLVGLVTEPDAFLARLNGYGVWGRAVFVLLMALQVVLAVIPGHPFEVAGGFCFGVGEGVLLTSLGAALGSAVAFLLSRLCGAKAVKSFYSEEKLQKLSFFKSNRSQTLFGFLVFLLPGIPKDMAAYFMGLTKMRLSTFLLISTVGRLPGIFVAVLGGAAVKEKSPWLLLLFAAVLLLLIFFSLLLYRLHTKGKKGKTGTEKSSQNGQ